jgi:hypothetical protein
MTPKMAFPEDDTKHLPSSQTGQKMLIRACCFREACGNADLVDLAPFMPDHRRMDRSARAAEEFSRAQQVWAQRSRG